ncbi:hypothetical protein ACIA8K_17870 [Catenuloplanes sp. NPDC051500]|uniref:hypothetical protein n=1 Tax=Catenuloplanes sp. NPDC051500 TaxID=3363959 RepID=UPI0037ABFE12
MREGDDEWPDRSIFTSLGHNGVVADEPEAGEPRDLDDEPGPAEGDGGGGEPAGESAAPLEHPGFPPERTAVQEAQEPGLPRISDVPGLEEPWSPQSEICDLPLTTFTREAWESELLEIREQRDLIDRIDRLTEGIDALRWLPSHRDTIRDLRSLDLGDLDGRLRTIGTVLKELLPAAHVIERPWSSAEERITLLEAALAVITKRGAPEVIVLPAPDGRIDGRMPKSPVGAVTVEDSRAVMYGADATLIVVHDCEIKRPVIEIASLIDYVDEERRWTFWSFAPPPARPATAQGTDGMKVEITGCHGVSIGDGNVQRTVIRHRLTGCPVDMAYLLAQQEIRDALAICRDTSLSAPDTEAARQQLRHVVTALVRDLTDIDALLPPSMIAAHAASAARRPAVRGGPASLRVIHGAGVAVGWRPRVRSETRTRVGHFHVR